MSLFLLDTDHLTLYQMGHPQVLTNVARHLTDQLAISVISTRHLSLFLQSPQLVLIFELFHQLGQSVHQPAKRPWLPS